MERTFKICPSCRSPEIGVQKLHLGYPSESLSVARPVGAERPVGLVESCPACSFISTYVRFTCGHCNLDVFAVCPRTGCRKKGAPGSMACTPGVGGRSGTDSA